MAATPDGRGAWLVGADGGVFALGSAGFHGSVAGRVLNGWVVSMAATPDGGGYWVVASDGGVFSFGDARFFGSAGGLHLSQPIVGMAATPDGGGYWLVASDGGVFAYGDAVFHGSTGGLSLARPVIGMAVDARSGGYWLTASDGGVFAFDAPFEGSTGGVALTQPVTSVVATPDGGGYRLVAADGGVFAYGDATYAGSGGAWPVVAVAGTPDGLGYWTTTATGSVKAYGDATNFGALEVASGPFAYERTNPDGSPSRWNPCQSVPYVINLSEAPAGALGVLQQAIGQLSAATGLSFAYQGTTNELASTTRPLVENGAWAPLLVVWEQVGQSSYLPANGEDGQGGFTAVRNPDGKWVDVSAQVALDADAASMNGFAEEGGWMHLLLHELGHAVGLAHVNDVTQVMNPIAQSGAATSYGSGDLAGLAGLGAGSGCLAEPSTAGF
jgi:hypothetical protein